MVLRRFGYITLGALLYAGVQVAAFELLPKPWSYDVFGFLSFATMWATVAVVSGFSMTRVLASVLAGAWGLLVCVWAYYFLATMTSSATGFPWWPAAYWSAAAIILGPLLGAVGALGRRRDAWNLIAWIGVAVAVAVDAAYQFIGSSISPWSLTLAIIFAVAVLLSSLVRLAHTKRNRSSAIGSVRTT